jgi:hypothetical protein
MAWPAPATTGVTSTWDKTANTFDRSVDQKLWAALMAKSPILDMVSRVPVDNFKFEWETDVAPVRTYTSEASGEATDMMGSAHDADNLIQFTSVTGLEQGAIMKNISRVTTVGSYGQDELLEVKLITGLHVDFNRDIGAQANADTNSTAHTAGDVYQVVYTPKPEGSGPDANKYTDVGLESNYCNSVDFYLTVTGDQAAVKRLVAGDTVDNQFQKNLLALQNDLEGMFFYGAQNATTAVGSASQVRRTKGFDAFLASSSANYDITTKDVTPTALDSLFAEIMYDKTDPSDRFIIACNPFNARKISQFGIDKVVTDNNATKWGRHIDTFKTDLGVEAPVIWSLNISRSDLFIIDMDKVSMPVFRPFTKAQWTYGDDGVDAFRQRYLGSLGVKVVDAMYSHAKLGLLPWS